MPTTTNFGWTTPADTDLVKDGAAAIRTLGNGIDTSLLDLKGGTTGQNLRKASNTDLDFTFAGDATNTVVDAAGDLLYGTANDTLGRLAIGTAGQVLKVNSGATAPEWGTASAADNFTLLNSGGTSLSGTSTSVSFSAQNQLFIYIDAASANDNLIFDLRLNGSTTSADYYSLAFTTTGGSTLSNNQWTTNQVSYFDLGRTGNAGGTISLFAHIKGANAAGIKPIEWITFASDAGTAGRIAHHGRGYFAPSSTITSMSVRSVLSNSFDNGTIYIYGA